MKYIWNNYSEENKYILGTESIVPGVEVWDNNRTEITVNVLPRLFDLVFPQKLTDSEEKYTILIEKYINDEVYKEVFNLLMHFQVLFDKNSGLSVNDGVVIYIETMILNNHFGDEIRSWYEICPENAKYFILNSYAEYLKSNNKENQFERFLETYFRLINVYHQKSENKDYIYLHVNKTEENLAVLNLADYFLRRIDSEITIMWKGEHIPIIGFDYTMIVDNMCI